MPDEKILPIEEAVPPARGETHAERRVREIVRSLNRRQRRAYLAGRRSGMDEETALRHIRARR